MPLHPFDSWPSDRRLVVATHNPGKLREARAALAVYPIPLVSAGELGLPVPDETGTTFVENALLKAHAAAEASGLPALADDSGLCVPLLDGRPGVHSADWEGPERSPATAMRRLEQELNGFRFNPAPEAFFVCVLALVDPTSEDAVITVEGRCDGTLTWPPRGSGGHGYDPMFVPAGSAFSFGEMTAEAKAAVGHRGAAFRALIAALGKSA